MPQTNWVHHKHQDQWQAQSKGEERERGSNQVEEVVTRLRSHMTAVSSYRSAHKVHRMAVLSLITVNVIKQICKNTLATRQWLVGWKVEQNWGQYVCSTSRIFYIKRRLKAEIVSAENRKRLEIHKSNCSTVVSANEQSWQQLSCI